MKNLKIAVKENEEKTIPIVWLGKDSQELTLEASLVGEGASFTLLGIILGEDSGEFILKSNIYHKARNTKSRVHIRGVLHGQAKFNNEGLIRIAKGAKGADGFLTAKVLLFDEAKGRSVPSLEIDENEVKAGHASSVGRPSDLEFFYLQSRGLSKKMAEELLINGFLSPILQRLPEEQRRGIQEKLFSRSGI